MTERERDSKRERPRLTERDISTLAIHRVAKLKTAVFKAFVFKKIAKKSKPKNCKYFFIIILT